MKAPRTRLGSTLLLVSLLVPSGCGTTWDALGPAPKGVATRLRVYGGVRLDFEALRALLVPGSISFPWLTLGVFLDFPLSFALDTALLPITIPWSIFADGGEPEPEPVPLEGESEKPS